MLKETTVGHVYWIVSLLMVLGCAGGGQRISLAVEQAKLARVQIGMTHTEVETIMGTESFIYYGETHYGQSFGRPMRVDRFTTRDGAKVMVYFYRSTVRRDDSATSDDETTAIIFINGKVDAILSGDFAKDAIEVRFR